MRNIFDSHAHYDDSQFNPDREELLGRGLPQARAICPAAACGYDGLSVTLRFEEG